MNSKTSQDDTSRVDKMRRMTARGDWGMKHERSQKRARNLRRPKSHR